MISIASTEHTPATSATRLLASTLSGWPGGPTVTANDPIVAKWLEKQLVPWPVPSQVSARVVDPLGTSVVSRVTPGATRAGEFGSDVPLGSNMLTWGMAAILHAALVTLVRTRSAVTAADGPTEASESAPCVPLFVQATVDVVVEVGGGTVVLVVEAVLTVGFEEVEVLDAAGVPPPHAARARPMSPTTSTAATVPLVVAFSLRVGIVSAHRRPPAPPS